MKVLLKAVFYEAVGVLFLLAHLLLKRYHELVDSVASQDLICIILPTMKTD